MLRPYTALCIIILLAILLAACSAAPKTASMLIDDVNDLARRPSG